MGGSKRKWTVAEEATLKRRNLGVKKKANRRYKNNGQKGSSSSSSSNNQNSLLLSKNDSREMASKAGVDEELEQMKKMSIREAEMAAAKAVAEAEAAVAAAERAVEDANEAEGIAEELGKEFYSKSLHQKKQRWWQKI